MRASKVDRSRARRAVQVASDDLERNLPRGVSDPAQGACQRLSRRLAERKTDGADHVQVGTGHELDLERRPRSGRVEVPLDVAFLSNLRARSRPKKGRVRRGRRRGGSKGFVSRRGIARRSEFAKGVGENGGVSESTALQGRWDVEQGGRKRGSATATFSFLYFFFGSAARGRWVPRTPTAPSPCTRPEGTVYAPGRPRLDRAQSEPRRRTRRAPPRGRGGRHRRRVE